MTPLEIIMAYLAGAAWVYGYALTMRAVEKHRAEKHPDKKMMFSVRVVVFLFWPVMVLVVQSIIYAAVIGIKIARLMGSK